MCRVYLLDIENLIFDNDLSGVDLLRANYISSINDLVRKKQSFFVWKLLIYALKLNGYNNVKFTNTNGKWCAKNSEINFSLSHSQNMVCVAVNKGNIGVDIEKISDKLYPLEKRYKNCPDNEDKLLYLSRCFTGEEAKFKAQTCQNVKNFIVFDKKLNKYSLSVCTDSEIEIINVENI